MKHIKIQTFLLFVGILVLIAQNDANSQAVINMTINQPQPLAIEANNSINIVEGESVILGNDLKIVGGTPSFTYNWSSDIPITSPENLLQEISPKQNGTYTLTITDSENCIITKEFSINVTKKTDISRESDYQTFTFYPNPTTGIIDVVFSSSSTANKYCLRVFDVTGKLVCQKEFVANSIYNNQIDLSDKNKGIYILKVASDKNIFTEQIILE